ncbi:M23 family metallopeptidase [Halalkalibacterium ligniniphilum]|uniref:M23 family metallopeptidase n=1 Tax=Halalkalibacterium ligniniphilum TaxID=1134413 RepID=UPI00034CBB18|nr:M23 family metallopeptidase [Halalkalibacterium ligniniphilum]
MLNEKKVFWLSVLAVMMLIGCQANGGNVTDDQNQSESHEDVNDSVKQIPFTVAENEVRVVVDDLTEAVEGSYEFDEVNRTLSLTIHDDSYYLIDGVPVLERNGEYVASDDIYLIEENGELYLPAAFLEQGMGLELNYGESQVAFQWFGPTERVGGPPENFDVENWDVETMVEYLSFLEKPIKNAQVSTIESHLPGAPREYRNGFHEGIDWYDFASGGDITTETPIYAMADGVVVRADHDYEEYSSPEERDKDLALATELGETPEYIFDRLRGQQVWVQYQNGVMNRFAHLSSIPESIKVGDRVNSDTVIGYVGNSGTSSAVNQQFDEGLHLHQDLLIYGELFWKPLTLEETKEVLTTIWN